MLPVHITIRSIPDSPAIESVIQKRAEKLTHFYKRINSCRVVVEVAQNHKHQGKLFNVRVDITVPGKEFAVTRKQDADVYVAIRDAFNAVERRLESYAGKRRGHTKTHEDTYHGVISRLVPDEGYGFIKGGDGSEYYFSLTNVAYPRFEQLVVGDSVAFMSEPAQEGMQAHRVTKERNNHNHHQKETVE